MSMLLVHLMIGTWADMTGSGDEDRSESSLWQDEMARRSTEAFGMKFPGLNVISY